MRSIMSVLAALLLSNNALADIPFLNCTPLGGRTNTIVAQLNIATGGGFSLKIGRNESVRVRIISSSHSSDTIYAPEDESQFPQFIVRGSNVGRSIRQFIVTNGSQDGTREVTCRNPNR